MRFHTVAQDKKSMEENESLKDIFEKNVIKRTEELKKRQHTPSSSVALHTNILYSLSRDTVPVSIDTQEHTGAEIIWS